MGREVMKIAVKRLIRDEKGQTMILALILLVVGGLIMAPLLAYMSTGLIAGEVYERGTAELYAADAGVEDALWQLKEADPDIPTTPGQSLNYTLNSAVNNKTIEVTIDMISGTKGAGLYKITSTATSTGGSNTTIESYISTNPLYWDHAITSTGDITLQPNSEVYGDVMGNVTGSGTVYGNITDPYDSDEWPFTEDFRAFYWPQVENATLPYEPCPKDTLDVSDNSTFGPGFHDGNLFIENNGGVDNITATLTGTVYIRGDDAQLYLGAGGNEPFYLDLNYQTIYVEGCDYDLDSSKNALYIGGKVHIKGSGAIIAEGNIYAQPNMEAATEDDFIFLLSLYGGVQLQPNGTLYGTVAAQEVYLGPGNILSHTYAPTDPETGEQLLSFPLDAVASSVKIFTWDIRDISQQ